MDAERKSFKRKFNNALEPIKVMLAHHKHTLPTKEWLRLVKRTQAGVLEHPDQYLGENLPEIEAMIGLVNEIFGDFLEQQQLEN